MHGEQQALQEVLPTLPVLVNKLTPPVDSTLLHMAVQARSCPSSVASTHQYSSHVCSWVIRPAAGLHACAAHVCRHTVRRRH